MSSDDRIKVSLGLKLVSLLLIVGGVVGIGLTLWLDLNFVNSGQISLFSPTIAITGAFIVLFGWAAWTGRELWTGNRRALTWAKILFGIQIPLIQLPGFSYEFHTGFTLPIRIITGPRLNFGFNFGSSFTFYISPQIQDVAVGINLVALIVLIYLERVTHPPAPAGDKFGLL
jgi:hypothetical protein